MPRFKRRSRHYHRKKHFQDQNGSDSQYNNGNGPLTATDRALLLKYLLEYKSGCERVCFPHDFCQSDEETVVTAPAARNKSQGMIHSDNEEVEIGGSRFPALTNEVLSRPYLTLPKTITSKHRRAIHELCVDADLFHCGVGDSRGSRYIVISIHSDGFDYVKELKNPPEARIPARRCRPWFHRTDHTSVEESEDTPQKGSKPSIHPHVKEQTKRGKQQIEQLLDQPGTCIRDNIDKIDFKQLDGEDLSEIDPPGLGQDETWMLIDSADKMKQCVRELQAVCPTEIAFDMEMYNLSKYTQVTCMFQLTSNAGKDYVIDTLAPGVWDQVSLLAPFFADPAIVKVGHSIGSLDVRSLHRDFGIFCVNAFDTYEAAKQLKTTKFNGLANVCEAYGLNDVEKYKNLKELYQTSDWRVRPLTDEMIQYGRYDIHYLLPLRKLMMRDLTRSELWDNVGATKDAERRMIAKALASTIKRIEAEEDGFGTYETASSVGDDSAMDVSMDSSMSLSRMSSFSDDVDGYFTPPTEEDPNDDATRTSEYDAPDLRMQADLMRVISHSQQRCLDLWTLKTESPTKNDMFVSVIYRAGKGELQWSPSHMALYEDLCHWRDTVARREGMLPGLVCPLDLLVTVAVKRPPCEASLRAITYYLPHFIEDTKDVYLNEILSLVRASLEKDGLSTLSSMRKYSISSSFASKRTLRKRRIVKSLGAVVVVGAVAAVAVTLSRKRR